MIEYNLAKKEDIKQIASFIADFNSKKECHIGYCGTDREEIENSLIEDILDIPFQESFIVAKENEKLIGVLGFDSDIESNSAEIWGPFIIKEKWNIAVELWDKMIKKLPKEINLISMFVNKENKNCIQLATNLNFNKVSEETILIFERKDIDKLRDIPIIELSSDYNEDMQSLHDKIFPNTYYSGSQIIDRMNNHRKVFINIENKNFAGYIYVEVNPEFGEGSIEFFAVDESERGKGIGSKLLTMALRSIFTFASIDNITLCVNSENEKALKLYKKVGFIEKHQLYYFTKKN